MLVCSVMVLHPALMVVISLQMPAVRLVSLHDPRGSSLEHTLSTNERTQEREALRRVSPPVCNDGSFSNGPVRSTCSISEFASFLSWVGLNEPRDEHENQEYMAVSSDLKLIEFLLSPTMTTEECLRAAHSEKSFSPPSACHEQMKQKDLSARYGIASMGSSSRGRLSFRRL